MTNRIGADVDALEAFLGHLTQFNRELDAGLGALRRHWSGLGSVWTDDMYARLGEALAEVTPGIDRYLAEGRDHEAYLHELIRRLQAALDLHGGRS